MGDDGAGEFDGCEYIWSHELATNRMINLIRQTQDYCTENECLTDAQRENGVGANSGINMGLLFVGFWFLLAIVLFFMRPKRSIPSGKGSEDPGSSFDPPAPTAS